MPAVVLAGLRSRPPGKSAEQGEVVAMDVQAGMLDRAREKARAENLTDLRFLEAGLGAGKLGRNQFDRALLVTVLGGNFRIGKQD